MTHSETTIHTDKRRMFSSCDSQRDELIAEVDLKWLFAGQGRWVDPDKLHSDASYAARILGEAVQSPLLPLHDCAIDLQTHLL